MNRTSHRPARRPPSAVRALSPLRDFLALEAASGILLVLGTVAALVWANSPWSAAYRSLWSTDLSIGLGGHELVLDLRAWVTDGAMTIFFFVVGLEIKRELTHGHLAAPRAALLPIAAAVGGMVVPVAVYLAIAGSSAPGGWAIPMATDIALAVGILAVAGDRVPPSLRAFLLALAIVDDIGAILIIAVFYSDGFHWRWLAGGLLLLGLVVVAARWGVRLVGVYVAFGAGLWLCFHESGVHATLAGVVLGLLAPATAHLTPELVDVDELLDLSTVEHARTSTQLARESISVVEWLQHLLHPWTSYLIVPVFAFANAGIEISSASIRDAAGSALTWGIIAGLVVGKPLGILAATALTLRAGAADAPVGSTSSQRVGIAAAGGIGFTVALFIADLAFTDESSRAIAKLAVLVASAVAALVATATLRRSRVS